MTQSETTPATVPVPDEPLKWSNGRLSPTGIREIHRLHAEGKTYFAIACAVGVCPGTVYGTISGRTNKHLHPAPPAAT